MRYTRLHVFHPSSDDPVFCKKPSHIVGQRSEVIGQSSSSKFKGQVRSWKHQSNHSGLVVGCSGMNLLTVLVRKWKNPKLDIVCAVKGLIMAFIMQKGFEWITFISHSPVVLVRCYKFGYFTLNFYGLIKKVVLWTISTYYILDHDLCIS